MKIIHKLILETLVVVLFVVIVGTVTFLQNKNSQDIVDEDLYRSILNLDDVWKLMEAQEHQEIAANNYLFLDTGLEERRTNYFYEKERLAKTYQKFSKEACEYMKPLLKKYYENMKIYNTKIEVAFELHSQGADLELTKERVREANKYVEIAHEAALEPIIEYVHKAHIEPAKENIAKGISRTTNVIIIVSVITVFLAIGLGIFISRSISLPIVKLKDAAAEIGKGNLNIKIEVTSNDEIGQLTSSFKKMTEDLKETTTSIINLNKEIAIRRQAEEVLRVSESKYRVLLENLPQKIFLKDKSLIYLSCNENYAWDLKIKADEITGKTDYDFHPEELAEKYKMDDKRIMDSGKTENIEEKYIQDGRESIVHTTKTPIKDKRGNAVGILGIFWDITERKQAEEQQSALMKDLEETNKIMVGRELRMIELKKEVNKLSKQLKMPAPYDDV